MFNSVVPYDVHNAKVLQELNIGDMVEFPRGFYTHWGVYIGVFQGNPKIAHLAGRDIDVINGASNSTIVYTIGGKMYNKAYVQIDDFWDVVKGCYAKKNNDKDMILSPLPADKIVEMAMASIGQIGYDVLVNNCEHFAAFLRYGKSLSHQANIGIASFVAVGLAAVAAPLAMYFAKKQ
ncbi:phospholipase A and acyltransferase 2-like [Argopecten irradians]|uniref:phospholipase A and acyltransferase 2-like n=1 Tax=Argopecten irradians TaxID=31199 RepID=UPI0037234D55